MLEMVNASPAERAAMGEASRRKVEREFDERMVLQRYLSLLDGLFAIR
jgi:hypothetical protein